MDYFGNALKTDSSSLEALYNLGMLYQENDLPLKALEKYASMLELDPDLRDTFEDLFFAKMQLPKAQFNPSTAVLNRVLQYSTHTAFETQF